MDANRPLSEIPRTQRRPLVRPLAWYFGKNRYRNKAVLDAFRSGGCSTREIGDHIGLHYSTISRIIRRGEKDQEKP